MVTLPFYLIVIWEIAFLLTVVLVSVAAITMAMDFKKGQDKKRPR